MAAGPLGHDQESHMDVTGLLTEAMSVVTPEWWRTNWDELVKIIMIDVVLAGDNAIVVGLAASRVSADVRNEVIFWGITAAVVLRILSSRDHSAVADHWPDPGGRFCAAGLLEDVPADHLGRGLSLEDIESGKCPRARR